MKSAFLRRAPFLLVLVPVFLHHTDAFACAHHEPVAVFSYTLHPDFPLEEYAAGKLGIIQPTYARSYLIVAYRYLANLPLSASEQRGIVNLWKERLGLEDKDYEWWPEKKAADLWLQTRAQYGGNGLVEISPYFRVEDIGEWYIVNCSVDAFRAARETLIQRVHTFGVNSTAVKEWLSAQDAVFSNCSGNLSKIPDPAPGTLPIIIQKDRAYQIAAAYFYARQYDEAYRRFREIAKDKASPYRKWGAYLAARSLVRKATVSAGPNRVNFKVLEEAAREVENILADSSLKGLHAQARGLRDFIYFRLDPPARLIEIARELMKPASTSDFRQLVWDYTWLLDFFLFREDEDNSTFYPSKDVASKFSDTVRLLSKIRQEDDLTDWLITFQMSPEKAFSHALEKYQETRSEAWLLAALVKARGQSGFSEALLTAAEHISPASKAYITARFHLFRLWIEMGRTAQARQAMDTFFSTHQNNIPRSSLNSFLAMRTAIATNLSEYLRFSQRVPTAIGEIWSNEIADFPIEVNNRPFFDADATQVFNLLLPLELLTDVVTKEILPPHLSYQLALMAWTRAVLVGDWKTASVLTPFAASAEPRLGEDLKDFNAAKTPEQREFIAIFILLKYPGMKPFLDVGYGRTTPIYEMDDFRDNWWCSPVSEVPPQPPSFLTPNQRTEAQAELQRLTKLEAAPSFLARRVITYAKAHKSDPRVPEALHRVVKATRFARCPDKNNSRWSRAAFAFLHKHYPNSPWAKKTKYWY